MATEKHIINIKIKKEVIIPTAVLTLFIFLTIFGYFNIVEAISSNFIDIPKSVFKTNEEISGNVTINIYADDVIPNNTIISLILINESGYIINESNMTLTASSLTTLTQSLI